VKELVKRRQELFESDGLTKGACEQTNKKADQRLEHGFRVEPVIGSEVGLQGEKGSGNQHEQAPNASRKFLRFPRESGKLEIPSESKSSESCVDTP
jgi:hypothetical protein